MNCTVHPETAASAYCRTCGKPLCDACKHTVKGVIYCEDCIAHRLGDAVPPSVPVEGAPVGAPYPPPTRGVPSPGLAAVLGFIPGVGAMYNGQFMKALVHVLIFCTLIWMADHGGGVFGGLLIPFFVFYMVFDAYKTARARELGLPLPDPFGLERMFTGHPPTPPPPVSTAGVPPLPPQPQPTMPGFVPGNAAAGSPGSGAVPPPTGEWPRFDRALHERIDQHMGDSVRRRENPGPVGAFILIAIGVLFLINTLGYWRWDFGRFWPVILIALGVWLFIRRFALPPAGR
ncbi:MAG TPA: B-box zinc finger protein [Terriglobales bacterium]|nr:B-box zinc finger protein [Terriglobales bacterium]